MGLRINTNVPSINAQRNLSGARANMAESLSKLSSGQRINKASDDAAGLAISENLKAQLRGLRQASRNANDGISFIQTAEGGLNEIGNMLVRLRELSVQAASDTIGGTERQFLDVEFQQLKNEMERIAQVTQFNGTKLLNGTGEQIDVQIGIWNNPEQDRITYDAQAINSTLDALGISGEGIQEKGNAQTSLAVIDAAIENVSGMRANLGALQNRLNSTINNLGTYEENLSASNSRIRDVDVAAETAELTKNSIMTQAGVAVLSQANAANAVALQLLQ